MISFPRTMARSKVQPTHYPRIIFHFLRSAQLLSSLVVASVMLFFISNLRHDGYPTPWTFLLLLTVSFLTVFFLSLTILLHCCCGLNPRLNFFLNAGLLAIWTIGFALLAWWSSGTLGQVCNKVNWHNSDGIMVCRIYKALFAFAMLGFLSTVAAFLLDIYVFRRSTRRGKYNQMMDIDAKRGEPAHDFSVNVDAAFTEQRSFRNQRSTQPSRQVGYALPEEQFAYDDTGYNGAHDYGVNRR